MGHAAGVGAAARTTAAAYAPRVRGHRVVEMPKVVLASALARWLPDAQGASGEVALDVSGATVGAVLDDLFAHHAALRGYVLDEHGAVRHHVAVFVDGQAIGDKRRLDQPVAPGGEVYVMQALSGG